MLSNMERGMLHRVSTDPSFVSAFLGYIGQGENENKEAF